MVTGAPSTYYAALPMALVVNGAALTAPRLRLYGPGDVSSLDPRAVIRTEPRNGAETFEPNYLAAVELALPDLPWLFTPSGQAANKLRPWICLVVVPDVDGIVLDVHQGRLSNLTIRSPLNPSTELPDLDHIDSWAHAQVTGDALTGAALNKALDGNPQARLSRLISPRKLDPAQRYIACLVPTFHAGVNAGLGLPVDEHDVAPAWDANTTAPFTLPVYYQFRFQTGPGGDFASLARHIRPPTTALQVGTRPIDVSQPGFGAAAAPGVALLLDGALRAVDAGVAPWPTAAAQTRYEAQLRKVLSHPTAVDPVVTPPLYGHAQSGQDLPAANTPPLWLGELNLDPRTRATASAGAQVVQRDQEAMVASAWDQLGEIRKANQLLRQAQLAREVSGSLVRRHLDAVAGDGNYLQITAPVQARVLTATPNLTMRGAIAASRLPLRSVSGTLRRVARVRGPIARRMQLTGTPQVVDRLNLLAAQSAQAITAAGPVQPPGGMVALDSIAPAIQVAKMTPTVIRHVPGWITSLGVGEGGGVISPSLEAAPSAGPATNSAIETGGQGTGGGVINTGGGETGGGTNIGRLLIDWNTDPTVPDFFKGTPVNMPAPFVFPSDAATFTRMQESFRGAAIDVGTYLNTPPPQFPDPPPLENSPALKPAREQLRRRLEPELTILNRVKARVPVANGTDPLQTLNSAPAYPQAMYAPLADLSPDWMLPGISEVPVDTATLLKTNPPFVEAYMVGLNEELAHELLWREFPMALHSTYFRNFWGAASPDIPPVEGFDAAGHLGDHTTDHSSGGKLVLLIRAQLFRRYPSAVVSAVKAAWNSDNKTRTLGTERKLPIFRGNIGEDVTFFAFDVDDPRGTTNPADQRPGWFFVIEEHVTEPRFGLEPDKPRVPDGSWNDLSWNDVTPDRGFLSPVNRPENPNREGFTWGDSAAAMAFILMRRPVRIAFHGRALIPEGAA
jgi:hypothetical protein